MNKTKILVNFTDLVVSYTSKAEIPVSSDSVIRDFEGGSSFLCLIRSSFSTHPFTDTCY